MSASSLNVILLAAGMGKRLSRGDASFPPKCLLHFDGMSLLQRHLEILGFGGLISSVTIVVGYQSDSIKNEVAKLKPNLDINFIQNDRFDRGSNLSLWHALDVLKCGQPVLFMDADVLYAPTLLDTLVSETDKSVVPYDTEFEPGEEPVKVCLRDGKAVDFGKIVGQSHDTVGEWPGFIRLSPAAARFVANILDQQVTAGAIDTPCEDSFRSMILAARADEIEFHDAAGIPWIEIDFPEDIKRARQIIAPRIEMPAGD